jgi:hypothetical protein
MNNILCGINQTEPATEILSLRKIDDSRYLKTVLLSHIRRVTAQFASEARLSGITTSIN